MSSPEWSGRRNPKLRLGASHKDKTRVLLVFTHAMTDVDSDLIKVRPFEKIRVLAGDIRQMVERDLRQAAPDDRVEAPPYSRIKWGFRSELLRFRLAAELESKADKFRPQPRPVGPRGHRKKHLGAETNILQKLWSEAVFREPTTLGRSLFFKTDLRNPIEP